MAKSGANSCCSYETFLSTNPNVASLLKIPESYHAKCHVCSAQFDNSPNSFRVVIRMTLTTAEEIQVFLRSLSRESYVTWRTTRCDSYMSSGRKNLFWRIYHCQNSNAKLQPSTKRSHIKRTGCTARLSVTVKRVTKRMRSLDPHLPSFPTKLEFVNGHNHEIFCVDSLKYRDVDPEVEIKFKKLFETGFTPTAALDLHKYDLQMTYGDEYHLYAADTCYCPSLQWCYRTYYKNLKSQDGVSSRLRNVNKEIDEETLLNAKMGRLSGCLKYERLDGTLCVAMCTPLMRRAHRYLASSSEVVFIDAFDTTCKSSYRVSVLLADSCAGGLPLGVLITASEDQKQLTKSFQLYKSLLNEESFCGNGDKGAGVFMIGNSVAERESLTVSFPDSRVLLCVAHLLKALWKYLWDENNGITIADRAPMFNLVRQIIYSTNEEDLVEAYVSAQTNAVASKYSEFLAYLCRLWDERMMWAAPYLPGDNSAIIEVSMKVLREKILHRARSYSVPQLIEFVFTRMDAYYERKLCRLAANNFENVNRDFALFHDQKFDSSEYEVTKFLECGRIFQVKHKGRATIFEVGVDVQMCSCMVGIEGFLCKHQYLVVLAFDISYSEFSPVEDEQSRRLLHSIAAGEVPKSEECEEKEDDSGDDNDEEIFNSLIESVIRPLANRANISPNLKSAIDTFKTNFESLSSEEDIVQALNSFGKPGNVGVSTSPGHLKTLETVPHVSSTVFRRILPKQGDISVPLPEVVRAQCEENIVRIMQPKRYCVSRGKLTQSSVVNEHDYSIPSKRL